MLKRFRQAYIPILTQITVPYVILALIIAAGGTYIITSVIVDSVEERFTNQLAETQLLAKEGVVREEDDLLESLRLITHIQGVDQAMVDRDANSLRALAIPAAFNANVGAIVFISPNGTQILSLALDVTSQAYVTMVPDTSYFSYAFLNQVLAGETDDLGDKFSGLIRTSSGTYLFIAGPIEDAQGNLVGAAMVGRSMDSLVKLLREETLGHLTIYNLKALH